MDPPRQLGPGRALPLVVATLALIGGILGALPVLATESGELVIRFDEQVRVQVEPDRADDFVATIERDDKTLLVVGEGVHVVVRNGVDDEFAVVHRVPLRDRSRRAVLEAAVRETPFRVKRFDGAASLVTPTGIPVALLDRGADRIARLAGTSVRVVVTDATDGSIRMIENNDGSHTARVAADVQVVARNGDDVGTVVRAKGHSVRLILQSLDAQPFTIDDTTVTFAPVADEEESVAGVSSEEPPVEATPAEPDIDVEHGGTTDVETPETGTETQAEGSEPEDEVHNGAAGPGEPQGDHTDETPTPAEPLGDHTDDAPTPADPQADPTQERPATDPQAGHTDENPTAAGS